MSQTTYFAPSSGTVGEFCLRFKYCHQLSEYLVFPECLFSYPKNADREL